MRRAQVSRKALFALTIALVTALAGSACTGNPTLVAVAVEADPSVPPCSVLNVFIDTGTGGAVPAQSFLPSPGPTFALPVLLLLDVGERVGLATVTVDARNDLGELIAMGAAVEPLTVGETANVAVLLTRSVANTCGNGEVDPAESCDGTDLDGVTCDDLGFAGGTLSCAANCSFDSSGCDPVLCGNAVLEPGELCDGADLGGETCVTLGLGSGLLACTPDCIFDGTNCTGIDTCGDGAINPGEVCDGFNLGGSTCLDFGFMGGSLTCNAVCQFDTAGCISGPICGDGIAQPPESCDGPDLGSATCNTFGADGGALGCTGGCVYDISGCYTCGDGVVAGPEACDGSDLGGATCVGMGFLGGNLGCVTSSCTFDTSGCISAATCGSGTIDFAEECDGADLGGNFCDTLGYAFGTLSCTPTCEFDTSACNGASLVHVDGLPSPTNGLIFDTLLVTTPSCSIAGTSVDVDITHPWLSDLLVRVESPLTTNVILHNYSGPGQIDLVGNYPSTLTVDGPGSLSSWNGEGTAGAWRLFIVTSFSVEGPLLNGWGLNFSCFDAANSAPGIPIPDAIPTGITDTVFLTESCTLSDVTVDVDISHTWQGDLVVDLTGPTGTMVRLHNNSGGGMNDIIGTYPTTFMVDGPGGLADFYGSDAAGPWSLTVADVAAADVGTLNSWGVNATCFDSVQASPGLPAQIPDGDADGIIDLASAVVPCVIADLTVDVTLTHPAIGDLFVRLLSPTGTLRTLHLQSGGATANLIGTYPTTLTPATPGALTDFIGEQALGVWRFIVEDPVPGNGGGVLLGWNVTFTCM